MTDSNNKPTDVHERVERRLSSLEVKMGKTRTDLTWIKGLLFALLALTLSGFRLFDPTLWHWP